ncbi:MAG: tRNA lysidine(34) synthetase TilS [bacterium]|nr:tRNA lysidine(34) synthetase TilS [bacterium]
MLQKVRRTVKDRGLLKTGDSVLVALSGGPDSVALLRVLAGWRSSMKLQLAAVYVNHGVRKRAARQEERFCRSLCDQLGISLEIVSEDIPARAALEKKGLEEAARDFRYAALERVAQERHLDRIALGHHADDQVETVIFRLTRGTGRSGLLGIPYRRGRIVRPFLDVGKSEILEYLDKCGQSFCVDKSNRESKFRRNYIRNRLLPALRKNLNPSIDQAVLNLVDSLEAEETHLEEITDRAAQRCLSVTVGGKLELDLKRFTGYDKWLRRRLLRRCLKVTCPGGLAPNKRTVERLDRQAHLSSGAVSLPGGFRAVVAGPKLVVHKTSAVKIRERLEPGQPLHLEGLHMSLSSRLVARREVRLIRKPRARKVVLDWDRVQPPLEVRTLGPGDRFRPLGMTGHKKAGDYLTDRKVFRVYRDEITVVCDKKGIIWLVGYELADRVKVDKNTRKVLTIAYTVRRKEIIAAV